MAILPFLLATVTLTLGAPDSGHPVPEHLWGVFFEDINWAADGGLYPELIANRGFETASVVKRDSKDHGRWNFADGWTFDFRGSAAGRISRKYEKPLNGTTAPYARIEVLSPGDGCGIMNHGYDGVSVTSNVSYQVRFYARSLTGYSGGLRLELRDGDTLVKAMPFTAEMLKLSETWRPITATFTSDRTVGRGGTFSVLATTKGTVDVEFVSLMPTAEFTYRGHGLRKDLCEALEALRPRFMRFPGGCVVESQDFQHWYDWKRTVTLPEAREVVWNRWGYWQSFGLGYYEYFQLCEDLGCEPLPICLAGVTCQYQKPVYYVATEDADYFAQNILDLIEFANGSIDSRWGRVRADLGHPAPFNLKMVGIGNENWGAAFLDRYTNIVKTVQAKYPEIRIVGTAGPVPDGGDFDLAWNSLTGQDAWVLDEHYYRPPEFFLKAVHRYDGYARTGRPGVYVGEYACHDRQARKAGDGSTLYTALCEAAAMTGFERNSDVVKMASYAPLFARRGHSQWKPDLIWFDDHAVYPTPNYYVQQLFSLNHPERTVQVTDDLPANAKFYYSAGLVGDEPVLKLVNLTGAPETVKLDLSSLPGVSNRTEMVVTTLTGGDTATPVVVTNSFTGTLSVPSASLTVLRVR